MTTLRLHKKSLQNFIQLVLEAVSYQAKIFPYDIQKWDESRWKLIDRKQISSIKTFTGCHNSLNVHLLDNTSITPPNALTVYVLH